MTDPLRPPETDDEPWAVAESDPLAPARGCAFALALSLIVWLTVAVLAWRCLSR